jgi:hypothetical protein
LPPIINGMPNALGGTDTGEKRISWRLPFLIWGLVSVTACLYEWFGASLHGVSGPRWFVGGDELWAVATSAFLNTHGGFAHLYAFDKPDTQLVTPPGLTLMVALLLHGISLLGAGNTSFQVGKGGLRLVGYAWNIVVPLLTLAAMAAIFPVDALARRLGIEAWRRWLLAIVSATGLWWVAVSWGHPDEAIAIGVIAGSLLFAIDGRADASAWCAGIGIAIQPLVLLAVPMILAVQAARRWPKMALRMVLPTLAVVLVPLLGDPQDTLRQLLGQPNTFTLPTTYPLPWLAFARHVVNNGPGGGPMRSVAIILSVAITWLFLFRGGHTPDPMLLVWLAGVAQGLRCVFESVLDPYYVVPGLLLLLIAAMRQRPSRIAAACSLAALTGWLTEFHSLGTWGYLAMLVIGLGGVSALAFPTRTEQVDHGAVPAEPTIRALIAARA